MATEFERTNLPFLEEDCLRLFGAERGGQIFKNTLAIYRRFISSADFRNNAAVEEHMRQRLFPAMSYYKALREVGFPTDDALEKVRAETQKAALVNRAKNEKFARMPFVYALYRMGVRKYMAKHFPPEGWKTEWVRCDGREIHFNLHSCLYHDLCSENGCPELCKVYCENDVTAFSGFLPEIRFERSGTLGEGAEFCDFHFIKGKKKD